MEGLGRCLFSGFGYELYDDTMFENWYSVVNGDGEVVKVFDTTFAAKMWMKANKTSNHWRADGKWDWNR